MTNLSSSFALLLLVLLASKLVLTLDISMNELDTIHKSQGHKAVSHAFMDLSTLRKVEN